MTIYEICKLFLPAKEVKLRLQNKQIKVNNTVVTNQSYSIELINEEYIELGEFLFGKSSNFDKSLFNVFDFKDFFGFYPTNVSGFEFFTNYTLIQISKKEFYVFKHKPPIHILICCNKDFIYGNENNENFIVEGFKHLYEEPNENCIYHPVYEGLHDFILTVNKKSDYFKIFYDFDDENINKQCKEYYENKFL
jgi:hypothetical protein